MLIDPQYVHESYCSEECKAAQVEASKQQLIESHAFPHRRGFRLSAPNCKGEVEKL
jgi:hypothetical protein